MIFMEQKISTDWCSGISQRLTAFNKAYIARKGNGLAQDIVLKGDDESVQYCVRQEAHLFAEHQIILSPEIITDKDKKDSPMAFFLENDNGLERIPGNIYFLKQSRCSFRNEFDVSGCAEQAKLQSAVDRLGFDALTVETLKETLESIPGWRNSLDDLKLFINNTLICHFSSQEDNVFHKEDLLWITSSCPNTEKAEEPMDKLTDSPVKSKDHHEQENIPQEIIPENTALVTAQETTEQKTSPKDSPVTEIISEDVPSEEEPEEAQEEANIPAYRQEIPEQENTESKDSAGERTEENQPHWKQKSTLSATEDSQNHMMLERLKQQYEATLSYIESLHNGKWRTLAGRMKQALEKSKFDQQWCVLYMGISQDYSTELYARLYRLDEITEKFNNTIVHQIVKTGCPMCGHTWEEDVTFLPRGLHFLECPNCYQEKGYEKK